MAILDLAPSNHPILKTPADKFDFANPQFDPVQLAKDLTETMISNNGMGLAAPQVGIGLQVFVISSEKVFACFNPKIVDISPETVYINEGCLSYPGLIVKVKRPRIVRVRFTIPNGETVTEKFDGLTSRIFQHEFDHLNGLCHLDLATLYHREQGYRLQKKLNRAFKRSA
jgi:peptide deformylase